MGSQTNGWEQALDSFQSGDDEEIVTAMDFRWQGCEVQNSVTHKGDNIEVTGSMNHRVGVCHGVNSSA